MNFHGIDMPTEEKHMQGCNVCNIKFLISYPATLGMLSFTSALLTYKHILGP